MIYDGANPNFSPMLGTLCGWNLEWSNSFGSQTTWTNSGSTAYLVFTFDGSVGAKGFKIHYKVLGGKPDNNIYALLFVAVYY